MRLLALFLILAALFTIPFLLWGEGFERFFSFEGTVEWLRGLGPWGWGAALALLVGDIVLPVPSTPVISGLGYVYGAWIGGALGFAGSFLSGTIAYAACRAAGERAARWLLGARDLERARERFHRIGAWTVALSRWVPILPEVSACMAGLTRLPARVFFAALACGALPMGFAYAAVGALGAERPWLTLALSALVPAALWPIAARLLGPRRASGG
jgi:uncharacterized membrane protein YdjX (TVP38/TMEM64 family)